MEYWNNFYKQNFEFINKNSYFSEWCLKHFNDKYKIKLLDIGCGNGRDLIFFEKNEISVLGIDKSIEAINTLKKLGKNVKNECILEFDYSMFNTLYCRFIIHTLNQLELEKLFTSLSYSNPNTNLFIETRISDNINHSKDFNSGIGENHKRYLYNKETILSLIEKSGFEIKELIISKGLSPIESEDPLILRLLSTKKPLF
jgi:tellurite methyltransferase